MIALAAILGAAHRRWLGSARPAWAFPGYRWMQVTLGMWALWALCWWGGDSIWRSALDSALGVGFMTLPIHISRRPFEWITERLPLPTTDGLPHPWRPMLQGPAPWAEALQGATMWSIAVLI